MENMNVIGEVEKTDLGEFVNDLLKKKLAELNGILFAITQADDKEEIDMHKNLLPQSDGEFYEGILKAISREYDFDKLSFNEGFFVAGVCRECTSQFRKMMRDSIKDDLGDLPDFLKMIIRGRKD